MIARVKGVDFICGRGVSGQARDQNQPAEPHPTIILTLHPHSTSVHQTSSWSNANGELCSSWYHSSMHPDHRNRRRIAPLWRAVIEVAFIVFLFYSNLLMGEFTATNGPGKSLTFALNDIFTGTNFFIAIISALIGYFVFEYLRKKL